MHDLAFADATRPRLVAVLGLSLRDYSIGHEILLLAKRNPLAVGQDTSELPLEKQHQAIIEAADICCQSWEDYHRVYRRWIERVKLALVWRKWKKVLTAADFKKATEAFCEYRRAGSQSLPLSRMPAQKGGEYRAFGQPDLAALLNFLMIDCHMPKIEALNSPLGECRMRYLSHLESQGALRIVNGDDMRHEEGRRAWAEAHPENTLVLHPKE